MRARARPSLLYRFIAWNDARGPQTDELSPEDARAKLQKTLEANAFVLGTRPALARVSDEVVAGVKVRRYVPLAPAGRAPLVYFHGGGWVLGTLDTVDVICARFAALTGRECINVDYRLAPEHRYPAAFDDCLAVSRAVATSIGGKVVVAGDSAGGNLAAAVALADPSVVSAQVLVYPVTDTTAESESYQLYAVGHFLTRETMRWFVRHYLPDEARRSEPTASPLRAPDLKGQPPTYVLLAECDVLHDEGEAYAKRLKDAGVEVVLDVVKGALHGFFSVCRLGDSKAAFSRLSAWLATKA